MYQAAKESFWKEWCQLSLTPPVVAGQHFDQQPPECSESWDKTPRYLTAPAHCHCSDGCPRALPTLSCKTKEQGKTFKNKWLMQSLFPVFMRSKGEQQNLAFLRVRFQTFGGWPKCNGMLPFVSVQNALYCEGFQKIFLNIAFVWFRKWTFTKEWYSRWIINLCISLTRLKSKVPPLGWWVSIQRTSWRNIQRRRGKTLENASRLEMSALILYLERQRTLLLILALRFPKVCRISALLAPDL